MKTAILVDGGFYRRRAQKLFGEKNAEERANELFAYCLKHLEDDRFGERMLYRIFYYDCPPMSKKIKHPFTGEQIDYEKTELYTWTTKFYDALKTKRKFALRMGTLSETQAHFNLDHKVTVALFDGSKKLEDVTANDFRLRVDQKGVDMKIGIDIASLAYKKQVDQIVLIAGDSDFVPAAKLARKEGIDFILDPMGNTIKPELQEHIDGINSFHTTFKTFSKK